MTLSSGKPLSLHHPAVDAVLAATAELIGLELVYIATLTDQEFCFERVLASREWPGLSEGVRAPRQLSMCHWMLAGAEPATSDVPSHPEYGSSPAVEMLEIQSYAGVPIRSRAGMVIATLCGLDRAPVKVSAEALAVLERLADTLAVVLDAPPALSSEVVISRTPSGHWLVGGEEESELATAMVLADLLAGELPPRTPPPRPVGEPTEIERLQITIAQLEHALATRVVIEQAIGVLAERNRTTPRVAFDNLRRVARSRGHRVADLAQQVVISATTSAALPAALARPSARPTSAPSPAALAARTQGR